MLSGSRGASGLRAAHTRVHRRRVEDREARDGLVLGRLHRSGATFLENLQGLTTLKIYRVDADRHEAMNREAETFRQATMRFYACS